MNTIALKEKFLVGLHLPFLTSNLNGQASIDCGNHWQKFEKENCLSKIENKLSEDIFAVYHKYESNEHGPYGYFIGCEVADYSNIPDGMGTLTIPASTYSTFLAKGKMPNCVAVCWQNIWATKLPRKYSADFEVYGQKSQNWENAEVDVFIALQ